MKINITKETVGTVVKIGGMALLYGLAAMGSRTSITDMVDRIRYSGKDVSYSDAVSVVMDSNLFDSNKNRAMELIKRDKDADYYKSVIKILKSDMFDSNKLKAITILCEEEEES